MIVRLKILAGAFLLMFGLSTPLMAEVGKVIIAKGDTVALDEASRSRPLQRRSVILTGDTLVTGVNSELHIRFQDNAVLALRANSRLKISEYHGSTEDRDEKVLMELLSGGFRTITGTFGKSSSDAYEIRTPNASIGIRGTNYEALLNGQTLLVGVYDGGVSLSNAAGQFNLGLDSAFSFARVDGADRVIRGLVEPPRELKTPLATGLNAPADPNETSEADASARLQNEDEDLLIENLFNEPEDENDYDAPAPLSDQTPPTLMAAEADQESIEVITGIAEATDLSAYADLRLTQEQIRSLLNDDAQAGFVVINEDPTGYRAAVYEMPLDYGASTYTATESLAFTIAVRGDAQSIEYDILIPASFIGDLVGEINNQITTQTTSDSNLNAPPALTVDNVDGSLIFTSFLNDSGVEIVFSDFVGADTTLAQTELGLCDNGTTLACQSTFAEGVVSLNEYNKGTHFGYMVNSEQGPVFVNWESETLAIIGETYQTPDNVFRGNANATRTVLTPVDIREDGTNAIEWGYWNTSATRPAVLLKDPGDLAVTESIGAPFFYLTAPPAEKARLIGTKSMSNIVDWHATSSTATGLMSEGSGTATLTASLDVDFGNAEAVGSLTLADTGSTPDWSWSINYVGEIKGAQFQSDYGYGGLNVNGGSENYDAVGHVDGLFTETASDLGFVGGFNLQTTDDSHQAQGVFVLK